MGSDTAGTSAIATATTTAAQPPADVTCTTKGDGRLECTVSDEQIARIRDRFTPGAELNRFSRQHPRRPLTASEKARRTNAPLWRGIWASYRDFPISKGGLYAGIALRVLTRENIETILERPSGATAANHNDLRREYNAEQMTPEEARRHGIVATRVPLHKGCPRNIDWSNNPMYCDVDNCADVTNEIDDHGLPVVMYANEMPAAEVQRFLGNPAISPYYTRYVNGGPIACQEGDGRSYHHLKLFGATTIEFVMRTIRDHHLLGWSLDSRPCTTDDGVHQHDAIMFNSGLHAFQTLEVDVDGTREQRTVTISMIAAASTSGFRHLINFFAPNLPYRRFIGGSFAKKILVEAKENGWAIER